jgi:hypothetical protein
MKYIGFVKVIDKNIRTAIDKDEFFNSRTLDSETKLKVVSYLKKGQFFGGVMTYLKDLFDGENIGGSEYFTDGTYVWPLYYAYYLEKYASVYLPDYFIEYLKSVNYTFTLLEKKDLDRINSVFINEWSGRYKNTD